MKYLSILFIFLAFECKNEPLKMDPSEYLSTVEQENFKYSLVRYTNRAPKKATRDTKFDTQFDEEYRQVAQRNDLLYYYKDSGTGTVYFAIARIAPSLKLKKAATIGKLKYGPGGEIAEYEEAARTWKMEEPELKEKTAMLFEKYVKGEDLSDYYTKNANGEFYIEFPDDNTYYSKEKRSWETKTTQFAEEASPE